MEFPYAPFFLDPFQPTKVKQKGLPKKRTYIAELWRYHILRQRKIFTNFKEMMKYIKSEGWTIMYDEGECMIYLKLNNKLLDYRKAVEENKIYWDRYK